MCKAAADLTGQRFGMLTANGKVVKGHYSNGRPIVLWDCECDCGKHRDVEIAKLTTGLVKHCGCKPANNPFNKFFRNHEKI